MSRFTQADVTRAVKGAVAGGMKVERVEIEPDGRIVVFAKGAASKRDTSWDDLCTPNPWDESLKR